MKKTSERSINIGSRWVVISHALLQARLTFSSENSLTRRLDLAIALDDRSIWLRSEGARGTESRWANESEDGELDRSGYINSVTERSNVRIKGTLAFNIVGYSSTERRSFHF